VQLLVGIKWKTEAKKEDRIEMCFKDMECEEFWWVKLAQDCVKFKPFIGSIFRVLYLYVVNPFGYFILGES
jgi:hypothetical protein